MPKSKYSDNLIGMKCAVCGMRNYYTRKNKKGVERKIELKKYCRKCRKSIKHKEVKITGK